MNPLIRRRLPPSVRSLLTDIGPKTEWTEAEPDPVTKDGIVLPHRGAASDQDEFLKPAETQDKEATVDTARKNGICMLCKCKPSCYTCPRCNLPYCGLACYQSPDHTTCSEEFYKESVLQELKDMGKTESEEKKKMQEMLVALRQKAARSDGGMESLLKEAGVVSDDDPDGGEGEKVHVVELLSRLAELQQSGDGSETEIEDILRQLEEIGGGELLPGDMCDDTEGGPEELELADRLSGLDVDKLSEEELWGLLDSKEKHGFMQLVKGGGLGELVPLWKPWWEEHEEAGGTLVEMLEEEVDRGNSSTAGQLNADKKVKTPQEVVQNKEKLASKSKNKKEGKGKKTTRSSTIPGVPPISEKIPKLSSLSANPSPLICYGLVNALYGYTFTLCLLNNDTDSMMFEFCDMILALCEALNSSRVFTSVKEALSCGEARVVDGGYLDKEDPLAPARAVEAVAHIMTGRDRKDTTGYCLAALSQLRSVLSQARKALSKEEEEAAKRQKYFLAGKKCEFFQAWVLDNSLQIHSLAVELWNEHSRKESTRSSMEKAKTVVEENLRKEKSKLNQKLIEELS
ncbi:uncharacterized protein V6R79_014915 [Siganus canaliculatus]